MTKKPTYRELVQRVAELESEADGCAQIIKKLRDSERRFADIINFLPDAAFIIDTQGRVIAWNRAIEKLTGIKAADILGKGDHEYALPFYQSRRPILIDLALRWDEDYARTYEYVKKEGDTLISETRNPPFRSGPSLFWNSAQKLYGAGGETIGAIEVIRDITERLLKEEALRESEEKYSELFQHCNDGIFIHTTEGAIIDVNRKVLQLLGYSKPELLSLTVFDLHPQTAVKKARGAFDAIMRDGKVHFEIEFKKKSGEILTGEVSSSLFTVGGETLVQGIMRDITARKQTENMLRRYEQIVSATNDLMSIIDTDCRYQAVNAAYLEAHDRKRGDIIGKSIPELMSAEVFERTIKPHTDRCLAGQSANYREWFDFPGWGRRFMDVHYYPFRDEHGRVTGIVVNSRDISETKKLERQLIQAQKMEAIGTLAAGIAHDFNNLLMGIEGRTSLMLMETPPDHQNYEDLKDIEGCVRSATDLTKQLLGFARGGRYDVRPTDLNVVVKRQNRVFGRAKKEIVIQGTYAEKLWPVEVDRGQIEQVLLNLYVNAWQAMPGGGKLYVRTENITLEDSHTRQFKAKPGRYVKLSVTDTGVGMDEATLQRIFDPFFTTQELGRGTGLGLASAYGIIRSHEGFINVYSEKGRGTTFNVYLPASATALKEERASRDEVASGNETILLVDDEPRVAKVGKAMLDRLGYEVWVAASGEQALKLTNEHKDKIDLIILDMIMPHMSGGETFDRIKAIAPGVKVLLCSGYSINGQAAEIMQRGCHGFIQKPFNIERLSRKMREILDPPEP